MGVLLIRLCGIMGGMLLMCQNTTMRVYGARIKRYCVLMFKTYSSSSSLVITSRWFATSPLRAPVSVRLVFWLNMLPKERYGNDHSSSSSFYWIALEATGPYKREIYNKPETHNHTNKQKSQIILYSCI